MFHLASCLLHPFWVCYCHLRIHFLFLICFSSVILFGHKMAFFFRFSFFLKCFLRFPNHYWPACNTAWPFPNAKITLPVVKMAPIVYLMPTRGDARAWPIPRRRPLVTKRVGRSLWRHHVRTLCRAYTNQEGGGSRRRCRLSAVRDMLFLPRDFVSAILLIKRLCRLYYAMVFLSLLESWDTICRPSGILSWGCGEPRNSLCCLWPL